MNTIEFGIDTLKGKMGLSTVDAMAVIKILVKNNLGAHDLLQEVSDCLIDKRYGGGVEWNTYLVDHRLTHDPIKTMMEDDEITEFYIEPAEHDHYSIIITHDDRIIVEVPEWRNREMEESAGVIGLDEYAILDFAFKAGDDYLMYVVQNADEYLTAELYRDGRLVTYADISAMRDYTRASNGAELLTIGAMVAIASMMTDTSAVARGRIMREAHAITANLINKGQR